MDSLTALDLFDFFATLPDRSVDLIFADLPYETTKAHWDKAIDLGRYWQEVNRVIKPAHAVVMTASQPFTTTLVASNRKQFRYEWIWMKSNVTGWLDAPYKPLKVHESVLVFSDAIATNGNQPVEKMVYYPQMKSGGAAYSKDRSTYENPVIYGSGNRGDTQNSNGDRYPTSVLFFPNSNGKENRGYHPTQKPVKLLEYLISTYSLPGDLVIDPTCGSGTTAVAARNLERRYAVNDIDPHWIEVTKARLLETDPYLDRVIGKGVQHSLFSGLDSE